MDKSADRGGILCTAGDDRYRRNETIAHEKNGTSSHRLGATPNIFANFAGKLHLLLDSTKNRVQKQFTKKNATELAQSK